MLGQPGGCTAKAPARISSLEKNPENGKMPAIARHDTRNVACVIGSLARSPPIVMMSPGVFEPSCSIACITEPAPRNRQALKNAWVPRGKIAAVQLPVPAAIFHLGTHAFF